jgi:hypothetical protein
LFSIVFRSSDAGYRRVLSKLNVKDQFVAKTLELLTVRGRAKSVEVFLLKDMK